MNCGASSTDDWTTRIEAKKTTCREVGAEATGMGVGWSLGTIGGQERGDGRRREKESGWRDANTHSHTFKPMLALASQSS